MAENIRLSDAQLLELRTQWSANRNEALEARGSWPDRHAERYRRFLADPSLRPPGPWPDAPSFFIAVTRYVLEKIHSDLWQTLFASPQNIRLVPFGEEDVIKAQVATRFLHWTLRRLINFPTIASTLLFDALLDSVGVAKVVAWSPPWEAPPDAQRYFDRIVRIDAIDQGTLLVPPDATGLQYPDARYLGQEFHLRADDLVRMREDGYDIPNLDEFLPTASEQTPTERQQIEMEREGTISRLFHPYSFLFYESYERFPIDGRSKKETDLIVSGFPDAQAADGTTMARGRITRIRKLIDVFPQDDRPRRPFFPITIWPQPRQWRGLNIPDRIESMQDLINRLHEQLVNYGDVSMLPYVFANTFLTGDLPDLRQVRPGSTVAVEDVAGVQFAPTRSLNRHFGEQIQMAFANVERDTAVTDFQLGRQSDRPNAPRTATATLSLQQESRKTFSMLAYHAASQFEDILTFYQRLWQSILPHRFQAPVNRIQEVQDDATRDALERLFSGDTETRMIAQELTRQQLSGLFDAEVDINPEAPYERQTLTYLAQLVLPSTANYAKGQRELLKRVWEGFDQKGFEQIWPQELADIQTQVQFLTLQIQTEQLRAQLMQMQMAQQQAAVQAQAATQQAQMGLAPPNLAQPPNGAQPAQQSIPSQQNGANPLDAVIQQLSQTVAPNNGRVQQG